MDSCAAVRENQAKFNQDRHAIVVPTKQEEAVVVAQLQAPPGRSRWRPLEALPAPWQRQQQQCQDQKHGEETRPRAKGTNEPNEREGPVRTLLKTGAKPGMMAVALRDYNAQSVEELSVREGEAVKVLAVATGGWMYVRLVDQQQPQQQQQQQGPARAQQQQQLRPPPPPQLQQQQQPQQPHQPTEGMQSQSSWQAILGDNRALGRHQQQQQQQQQQGPAQAQQQHQFRPPPPPQWRVRGANRLGRTFWETTVPQGGKSESNSCI